jgi:formamidopyrimidine-DNA glycosylase
LLPGRRVARVWRRAKRVVVDLDRDAKLVFHLGMTGRLTVCDADEPIEKHTHLRVAVRDSDRELRFRDPRRFGGVWCLAGGRKHVGRELGELGPEPLQLTPARFQRVLDRPRQIKALLLDQRCIAGLGNIYCDEALHIAGIHPLAKADSLDRETTDRLLRAIKSTLRRAIRCNGSTVSDYRTADGGSGSFQKHHRVYQREGQSCQKCGTIIEHLTAAGRSTFICPCCQQHATSLINAFWTT